MYRLAVISKTEAGGVVNLLRVLAHKALAQLYDVFFLAAAAAPHHPIEGQAIGPCCGEVGVVGLCDVAEDYGVDDRWVVVLADDGLQSAIRDGWLS